MWVVALVWEVIRIGGGPAQLSVVSTAGAVGVLLPPLLGGVVADRVPQKLILLVVAAVELAGMALVAVALAHRPTALWHLAAVAFVTGMGLAFYYPAYSAWLPALVPESDLLAVNGFEGMVRPDGRPGDRPGRRRRGRRHGLARRRGRGRGRGVAARPGGADDGAADAGPP